MYDEFWYLYLITTNLPLSVPVPIIDSWPLLFLYDPFCVTRVFCEAIELKLSIRAWFGHQWLCYDDNDFSSTSLLVYQ